MVKYLVYGVVVLVIVTLVLYPLTKERFYFSKVEGVVKIHSTKWDSPMDFYFQYPFYVENHFMSIPESQRMGEQTVTFADGSHFSGYVQVSSHSVDISGTYILPTGAEWKYKTSKSQVIGGLQGVSGSADLKMPFTVNGKSYTAHISWTLPSGATVALQQGEGEPVKLDQHHFGNWW